ncbi:MAG: DUF4438 domain-containing protein [Candidatus Omnitrophica bacterium]|nr:DUF4438 domain-containing protein [Candidatus Omnitrophota bacterium]
MTKFKTNEDRLVKMAVQGRVANASQFAEFEIAHDGTPFALPSTGGIVYNVKTGHNVFDWEGDHIEPGVSAILDEDKRSSRANMGFNFLACIGNSARILNGEAKGKRGTVTGHHGGVEHVTIDFDEATLYKLHLDDKILIEAFGQGLKLVDFPDIKVYSLDPGLLAKLPICALTGHKLEIGVSAIVPAELMGSGMGHNNIGTGDCDIMTHDAQAVKKYNLDRLCFGDLVAVMDHDHSYGRTFRKGAVSVGVVVHSNSMLPGHGPGLSTLMTTSGAFLKPVIDENANIARLLKIGIYRKVK